MKISIIVPVYNVEDYLERCLNSLVNQILPAYEIILIDDGSTDRSGEVADAWAEIHDNIRVIHRENQGVSAARNLGIEEAEGDYILFVDSDDIIAGHMLERMAEMVEETDADVVVAGVAHDTTGNAEFPRHQNIEAPIIWNNEQALREYLKAEETSVFPVSKLFRADVLKSIRFDKDYRLAEDALFIADFYLAAERKTVFIPESLYLYCHREGSATTEVKHDRHVFDTIVVHRMVRKRLEKRYPSLEPELRMRRIWSYFTVYDKIILDDSTYFDKAKRKLRKKLCRSLPDILRDPYFRPSRKLAGILLCISKRAYRHLIERKNNVF